METPSGRTGVVLQELATNALVRRLQALTDMTAPEVIAANAALDTEAAFHPAGFVVQAQHQQILAPQLLVSGWAWRTRYLRNGREQVIAIVLPGDFIGLCWRPKPRALSSTVAITPLKLRPAGGLLPVVRAGGAVHPALREALTLLSRHDEMRLLDQVVRLGVQPAMERVAGLMLELHDRLRVVGLARGDGFDMPLTQGDLSKVLGLSMIHVNRTLQQLRREGLLEIRSGRVTFGARDELAALCGFDTTGQDYKAPI